MSSRRAIRALATGARRVCRAIGFHEAPPSQPPRRVVVTGLGLVTPLGCGTATCWDRLLDLGSGVGPLRAEDLQLPYTASDASAMATRSAAAKDLLQQLPSRVAAFVPRAGGAGHFDENRWSSPQERKMIPQFVAYALCAASEALSDARWQPTQAADQERTGVAIGGGMGSTSNFMDATKLLLDQKFRKLSPFFIPSILVNMAAGHVSIVHGLKGPNHTAATACTTGAHAIGDAGRIIRHGDADVMVAGGTEACIDALSVAGFSRLKALSTKYNETPRIASRPFDQGRDGFVIGEGAGVVVLEEYEHARQRGASMYAEIRGYGMSGADERDTVAGDAHHMTQPPADGHGAVLAMRRSIAQSGLLATDIGYLNAHATSTPTGDAVEVRAIREVFGEHAMSGALQLSSTKGATGHLLGAAGAVEAIFTILALHHATLPPTLNLIKPDDAFEGPFTPLVAATPHQARAALSNSFGFGGTNASLVFSLPPPPS
eukprot:SM000058S18483  [mRNA]  locus=s58:172875:176447:+ [translate_table: standard]